MPSCLEGPVLECFLAWAHSRHSKAGTHLDGVVVHKVAAGARGDGLTDAHRLRRWRWRPRNGLDSGLPLATFWPRRGRGWACRPGGWNAGCATTLGFGAGPGRGAAVHLALCGGAPGESHRASKKQPRPLGSGFGRGDSHAPGVRATVSDDRLAGCRRPACPADGGARGADPEARV
eukprot:s1116_g4.t1